MNTALLNTINEEIVILMKKLASVRDRVTDPKQADELEEIFHGLSYIERDLLEELERARHVQSGN